MRFDRAVGVDWSGAGTNSTTNRGLAVAEAKQGLVHTVQWATERKSRDRLIAWMVAALRPDEQRTLIGLDFAFGYPFGAMKAVFGASTWREMTDRLRHSLLKFGSASAVAAAINDDPRFRGHGPFRFNANRTDFRFYLDTRIAYYRLVESYVPQAISQWYLGSGATVGYSTITGLAALAELLDRRDCGKCNFRVFPFEPISDDAHVICEVYPAIWQHVEGGFASDHERDALRAANGLAAADAAALIIPPNLLALPQAEARIQEEGWVSGVA